jgi:2-(1,2-epoxy-1,2-dihydrophenyl)acetyl-CoA isomerase
MADLEVTIENGIATLTMNRPEARNALSDSMKQLMTDALHDIELDDTVRCVVLTGEGDHFMAGGDVKGMFETFKQTPAEIEKAYNLRIHELHTIMYPIRRMGKPVIASVRGAAAGAGVSFALMCDLVICSEDAFFTLAYCNIGTSPDGSSTFQLPRTMGLKKAMEMTLLGDRYTSTQALEMGLVNWVVPNDDLKAETDKLATRLANGPTYVYGRAKKLLYQSNETQWESQLQAEAESFAACAARADFKEGVTAFVEKRKPNFTGK